MASMKKRMLAAGAAACMCVSILPAPAFAAQNSERGVVHFETAVSPRYDGAQPFYEGLAAVQNNGKWGYVDESGRQVIPCKYDIAYGFSEGRAIVGTLYGNYSGETYYQVGTVDREGSYTPLEAPATVYDPDTGKEMETPIAFLAIWTGTEQYPHSQMFHNGYYPMALIDEPGAYLYGRDGKLLRGADGEPLLVSSTRPTTEGVVYTRDPSAYGADEQYYDLKTGKTTVVKSPMGCDEFSMYPLNQGLAPAEFVEWRSSGSKISYGIVDAKGKVIVEPLYQNFKVYDMTTEYTVFGDLGSAILLKDGKWGAVDKHGKTVIPFQYEDLWNYSFGLAAFKKDGLWGYLDENGKVAIPARYEQTSGFGSDGYAAVYDGRKGYLIDAEGNPVAGSESIDPSVYYQVDDHGQVTVLSPDAYVVIEQNGRYGFGHVDYLPPLPQEEDMHAWAFTEVTAAIEENLVPNYMQNVYLNNISRNEFCDLAVQAICEVEGKELSQIVRESTGKELSAWKEEYPFKDSTNENVIAAYALGVVSGRGNQVFDPSASITRQEAAAFLMRSAKVLGMDTDKITAAGFSDSGEVGVWFKDAVNFVYQIRVMGGTSTEANTFTPKGSYTREQSFVTIYRLFKAIKGL